MGRAEFHNQRVEALMHVSTPKKETSLTVRRNRWKAGLIAAGLLVPGVGAAIQVSAGNRSAEKSGNNQAQDCITYVVQPGDTLWDIAEKAKPGKDPRKMVGRLVKANGGPAITSGERLKVCK